MLTRLKVSGFKNLVDVDVRFGAFTCVAGVNGSGKSNLFDAIRFLSALASMSLREAALSVRGEGERTADIRNLFHRIGDTYASEMSFEAEMIIPAEGIDNLGQRATASITFVRYSIILAHQENDDSYSQGVQLELLKEELYYITLGDARKNLRFPHKTAWRRSVVQGRRGAPFISTEFKDNEHIINLHQDGGSSGRPLGRLASSLPRTVLSASNAAESPTVLLTKREMESWRLLQLEPSALRKPDEFNAPAQLTMDGKHLPATLYRLAQTQATEQVYSQIARRLTELIDDVADVDVEEDEKRELYTLKVAGRDGTYHAARSLSDGTLRFLALATLELDSKMRGVICMEEPENGIHPERIPAMLRLLQDIAMDTDEPVDETNPLRQVIVNTHSPAVVLQVPGESLLVAELVENVRDGKRFKSARFRGLPGTWRDTDDTVALGKLLSYLNPVSYGIAPDSESSDKPRVMDRTDICQMILPGFGDSRP